MRVVLWTAPEEVLISGHSFETRIVADDNDPESLIVEVKDYYDKWTDLEVYNINFGNYDYLDTDWTKSVVFEAAFKDLSAALKVLRICKEKGL